MSYLLKIVGATILAALIFLAAGLRADDEAAKQEKTSTVSSDLVGTWKLVGAWNVSDPQMNRRLKFFTGKHWNITQANKDGTVLFHHGGTYTIDGDVLSSTVEYANKNTSNMIGKTNKFKINVDGDMYTQVGVGNRFHEIWKRAD